MMMKTVFRRLSMKGHDLESHNVGRLEPLVNNRDTRSENRQGVMYEPGPSAGTRFRMEMPHSRSHNKRFKFHWLCTA
jgi:hypothetical protein